MERLIEILEDILAYEGPVFGASAIECGNYANLDLALAKAEAEKIPGVNVIPPVQNLKEYLFEYDLVVTHYGFTAFEALSANCAVVLLSTTKLHENLAKKYGFLCLSRKDLETPESSKIFRDNYLREKGIKL